jgi:hypothetical protein
VTDVLYSSSLMNGLVCFYPLLHSSQLCIVVGSIMVTEVCMIGARQSSPGTTLTILGFGSTIFIEGSSVT